MQAPVPLTADQREQIRRMLCKFGGVMPEEAAPETAVVAASEVKEFKLKDTGDVFKGAPGGTTIDISQLTTGSFRYNIVRISCALFRPLILDKTRIDPENIMRMCRDDLGVTMHRPTEGMLTGAVEQAEPILILQIELAEPHFDTVSTVRWVT